MGRVSLSFEVRPALSVAEQEVQGMLDPLGRFIPQLGRSGGFVEVSNRNSD